jgi:hypothetical protein
MDELASHLTLARITKVTIERRHKWLVNGGEEEGCCGCGISVVHRGIPEDGSCPPARGADDGDEYPCLEGGGGVLELCPRWQAGGADGQYPLRGGGGKYQVGGGGGSHV